MKHLIIQGKKDSGKSETIKAICKELKPSKVYSISFSEKKAIEQALPAEIANGTYVLIVNGKFVLVSAGAPTEQGKKITEIFYVSRLSSK